MKQSFYLFFIVIIFTACQSSGQTNDANEQPEMTDTVVQARAAKRHNATGILLYATIETDYNLNFKYNEHKIQIRTISLNSNWRNISSRLKEIIDIDK